MTAYRLPKGGRIDRTRTLSFRFDGASYQGHPGDTLASALMANGRMLMGRSFKYHRPRGPVTSGSAEPNALVTVLQAGARLPNCRATMTELRDGLVAESQNRWPSLDLDIGAVNGLFSRFLSAGFYYKTFMWPAAFWEKVYEPLIRRAAGLGRADYEVAPAHRTKQWAHCDLLVIGAGPTGLAAALTAGRSGARVLIMDEGSQPGGSLLADSALIDRVPATAFVSAVVDELNSMPNVRLVPRCTVFGWYDDMMFGAVERSPDGGPDERLWRIAARRAVLATGAEERPLVFGGNDRPGVMLAGAAVTYARRHAVAVGKKVAVFANSEAGRRAAADLTQAGVDVVALIDTRRSEGGAEVGPYRHYRNAVVHGTKGGRAVRRLTLTCDGRRESFSVDALAVSGGYSPRIHLACHRGAKPVWSEEAGGFLAPANLKGLLPAGSAAGAQTVSACLEGGASAAVAALEDIGLRASALDLPDVSGDWAPERIKPLWTIPPLHGKAFVDFQNDVHLADMGLAIREGFDHVELAKRYTTNGMATDQGKLSNVNAIGILAEIRGVSPAEVGTTTFRPFYTPVAFGALAGHAHGPDFQPVRRSPLHEWAARNGAEFVETGLWYRSAWFTKTGETHWRESVDREVANVRRNAGICDVSMLGKIEVFGTDAAVFLDRVYCNRFDTLQVGRARYGVMLREDGMVFDDGVTSRLEDDHFYMTTTTAYAARVLSHLEFCAQVHWPELDVRLASATDQWAQMAVAGPKSRAILQEIVDDDIANDSFPHMTARRVSLLGGALDGMLFRVSFSGELAFELAVPASYGASLADAILEAGARHGICPYGSEALGVLRIEKGHVTHAEIDGTVTAGDLGLGRMVSSSKADFIGKHMLAREGLVAPGRLQLVGVRPVNSVDSFRSGAHILAKGATPSLANDQGHVTSTCFSPHVGSTIGLALVVNGSERIGEEVVVWNALADEYTDAVLSHPVAFDAEGAKLHV